MAQTEFDRQAEVTRLLLEGISSTHVSKRLFLKNVSTQFHVIMSLQICFVVSLSTLTLQYLIWDRIM